MSIKYDNSYNYVTESKMLFSSILELWLSMNEIKIKKATYDKYLYLIEKHIIPELGNIELHEINAFTINSFIKRKLEKGSIESHSALSPSYVNTMAVIIKAALDYAKNENIYCGLNNPIFKPQKQNKEFIILTSKEIVQLDNYLNDNFGLDEMGILLALYMGLRVGEVCALSWDNVDLDRKVIHIKSTVIAVFCRQICIIKR